MDLVKVIGQRIRRMRNSSGMTQESLADRAGIHLTQVQRLEQGKGNPTLETLVSVSRALGVTLQDLVAPEEPATLAWGTLGALLGDRDSSDIELALTVVRAVLHRIDQMRSVV